MRLNVGIFTAAATIGLGSIPTTLAWGAAGHEIVATVAQIYLHPTVLSSVCEILYPGSTKTSSSDPPCHLSRVATWADQIRRQPQYRYSASLHYVGALDDHPSGTCLFPGERGWAGRTDHNVLGAVRNVTEIVDAYVIGDRDRSAAEEAMKFLIHFVGDMHMPLHLTGRERGGNGVRVTFDGRVTNLHSLWDGLLIAKSLRTIPRNYTHSFPSGTSTIEIESHLRGTIYDPYIRRLMYEGFGMGSVNTNVTSGRFTEESQEWLSCPQAQPDESQLFWKAAQTFLGLQNWRNSLPAFLAGRRMGGGSGDEKRWDDDVLCPYAWAKELHELNCNFPIWPRELDEPPFSHAFASSEQVDDYNHLHTDAQDELVDAFATSGDALWGRPRPHPDLLELDTPEYTGRLQEEWVVERLVAMAGARLAGILNGLFLQGEELAQASTILPIIPRMGR